MQVKCDFIEKNVINSIRKKFKIEMAKIEIKKGDSCLLTEENKLRTPQEK